MRAAALLGAASSLATTTIAGATDSPLPSGQGMDTHLFRPAADPKGFFTVAGAETLRPRELSVGVVGDWGIGLLRQQSGRAGSSPDLVDGPKQILASSLQSTLLVSFGVLDALTLGVSLPVAELRGDPTTRSYGAAPTSTIPAIGSCTAVTTRATASGFGGFAANAKLRFTDVEKGPGLALVVQAGGGASDAVRQNLGADKAFAWPQLAFEQRLGSAHPLRYGVNVGYRAHSQTNASFDQLTAGRFEDGNLVTAGVAVGYRVIERLELEAETYLTQSTGAGAEAARLSDEVALGGKVRLFRNIGVLAGFGARTTGGFEAANERVFFGIAYQPAPIDRDHSPAPGPVASRCPGGPPAPGARVAADGCAVADSDADGVPDDVDRCPAEPEDLDGFEDEDGCLDPDDDRDGILDVVDRCPRAPETVNQFEDEDGCPDERPMVVVQAQDVKISQEVLFKRGSADILQESFAMLDAVAKTLNEHAEITLLEIQGHADERATIKLNLDLTRSRARSVAKALAERGVDESRLRSIGFGAYCPIAIGNNEAAWKQNRRVEFKVVKTTAGPTGVELGCVAAAAAGIASEPVP